MNKYEFSCIISKDIETSIISTIHFIELLKGHERLNARARSKILQSSLLGCNTCAFGVTHSLTILITE